MADEERKALISPESSAWTMAHAGTGKTYLLVQRFLRLLLAGEDARGILCLTYTRAAAAEMKERLLNRLGEWSRMEECKLKKELADMNAPQDEKTLTKARGLFGECLNHYHDLKLMTIHSFCQDILRRFPLEAGVTPLSGVCDDRQAQEVQRRAFERFFETAKNNAELREALAIMVIHSSERSARGKSKSHPWRDALQLLGEDELRKPYQSLLSLNEGEPSSFMMKNFMAGQTMPYEALKEFYLTKKGDVRKKHEGDSNAQEFLDFDQAYNGRRASELLDATSRALSIAGRAYFDSCTRAKNEIGVLFYDDLLLRMRDLVEADKGVSWVMSKLDQSIDHILMDEAQDTSLIQWDIIDALTQEFTAGEGARGKKKRSFFVVGDDKQSIYSFSGADIEEYKNKHEEFTKRFAMTEGALVYSWRSSPLILEAVDAVFHQDKIAGVPLNKEHETVHKDCKGEVIVWHLTDPTPAQPKEDQAFAIKKYGVEDYGIEEWLELKTEAPVMLARKIVDDIAQRIESGEKAGGIMILVRTRGDVFYALIRELQKKGILCEEPDRFSPLEHMAVQDLIHLGQFVLAPDYEHLALGGLLKSPFCRLTDNDLMALRKDRDSSLWRALRSSKKETHIKAGDFLSKMLAHADFMPLYEFFAIASEYLKIAPEDRDAVTYFLNLCLMYERDHVPSMQGFLHWLEHSRIDARRGRGAKREDTIKISTVHGAKGLEAETIILADANDIPELKYEMGFLKNPEKNGTFLWTGGASLAKEQETYREWYDEKRQKEIEEYYRLLYVAMTRARTRLIVAGIEKKRKNKIPSWYETIHSSLKSRAWFEAEVKSQEHAIHLKDGEKEKKKKEEEQEKPHNIDQWQKEHMALRAPLGQEVFRLHLSPSSLFEDGALIEDSGQESGSIERGHLLHLLLQHLPSLAREVRQARGMAVLVHLAPSWSPQDRQALCDEALRVIECAALAPLFGEKSRAEVRIIGKWRGHHVSGRIDRMAYLQDKVFFVDFKTGAPLITPSPSWVRQMALYDVLLGNMYQGKKRKAMIVQTRDLTIHTLDEKALEAARASIDLDALSSKG